MLSRGVLPPLPMRPGWGESMAWPYLGVPAALVADLAGGRAAVLRPGGAHRRPRGGARGGESVEDFAGGGAGAWCVAVGEAGDLGDLRMWHWRAGVLGGAAHGAYEGFGGFAVGRGLHDQQGYDGGGVRGDAEFLAALADQGLLGGLVGFGFAAGQVEPAAAVGAGGQEPAASRWVQATFSITPVTSVVDGQAVGAPATRRSPPLRSCQKR
ncbi:hypothetical protein GCM10010236_09720 [Streptomyces eurythermus]|nr:hypothetical protein GCM10010236_09720 [Streptomyces eurythermus]